MLAKSVLVDAKLNRNGSGPAFSVLSTFDIGRGGSRSYFKSI